MEGLVPVEINGRPVYMNKWLKAVEDMRGSGH